jgi:hypothetical protein
MCAQVFMLIVLSIKRFPYSLVLIPLPFLTLVFHAACLTLFQVRHFNAGARRQCVCLCVYMYFV